MIEDEKQSCEFLNTQLSIKQQEIDRLQKELKNAATVSASDPEITPIQLTLAAIKELQALVSGFQEEGPSKEKVEEASEKNSRFKSAVTKIIASIF